MFDATFFATIGLFIFLAVIVYIGIPGKILALLDDRAKKIRKELDEARRLREEAQTLLADYQRRTREAEAEATTIVEEAKIESERLAKEAIAALDAQVERRLKAAEQKIEQAEARAIADVRNMAIDLAVSTSTNIVEEHMNSDKSNIIMDNSIKQVTNNLN